MKKLFSFLVLTAFLSTSVKAQYISIPDVNFRNFLVTNYPGCMNASQMLDTTCNAILNATDLTYHTNSQNEFVIDWEGFQYFRNLQVLTMDLYYQVWLPNAPAILPALPNSLKKLNVAESNITGLPNLPTGLTELSLSHCNNIQTLPALPATLKKLNIFQDQSIHALPAFPGSLTQLSIYEQDIPVLPAFPALLDTVYIYRDSTLTALPTLPNSMKSLTCFSSKITSLGSSLPPLLGYLWAGSSKITNLPAIPNQMTYLNVSGNLLTSLPSFPNSLTEIHVGSNNLNAIPALPPALIWLTVDGNPLTSLPNLPPTLKYLSSTSTSLTILPTLPVSLIWLACHHSQLTSLPASLANTAVYQMDCSYNQLTNLPALPATLKTLNCTFNQLTNLPVLPDSLDDFECQDNQLTSIPALPLSLTILWCQHNHITCMPVITANVTHLGLDSSIHCLPNAPGLCFVQRFGSSFLNSMVPPGQFPICNPVNNVDHCQEFAVMTGHVYDDYNNNSVKDPGETYRTYTRLNLSNGAFTFTDENGFYQIAADNGPGNYTLSYPVPNYFTSAPPQYNYSFSSNDTVVSNDFALQASSLVDSLAISVTPFGSGAIAGFPMVYKVNYVNTGTTPLSPHIIFTYDNTLMTFDSSSNAAVINNGTNLQLNSSTLQWGQSGSFLAYFHTNVTTPLGDTLFVKVTAQANAVTVADSCYTPVSGSYDPNDKSATKTLTPAQVLNGAEIDYTIRFQNTGTNMAFNVVLADTLSSALQSSTLKVISASHSCKITVKNNIAYFEFLNILLPDSNANELLSHGFVRFKVQPQVGLPANNIVTNKAFIYFDYNSPVETNTATTTIAEPIVVPLKLLSFNVVKQDKYNALVSWSTANEQNVKDFTIETSTDGRNYNPIAYENALGKQYNVYSKTVTPVPNDIIYFRLKSTDIDGRYSYSNIVILKTDGTHDAFTFLNNPVKNELNISVQDDALKNTMARIINAQGAVLLSFYLQHDLEKINVSSLPAGTYIFETVKGNKQFVIVK